MFDLMSASQNALPKGALLARAKREEGIQRDNEFNRISAIARRTLAGSVNTELLNNVLRLPGSNAMLMEDQALALKEMGTNPGTFIAMEVGSGKGLITLLSPIIRDSKRPLLLVPANMRNDTIKNVIPKWREHYHMHPNLVVESFEILSSPTSGERFLETMQPDHIIVDEGDKLKDPECARGIRFYGYFRRHPETFLDALSGSFFDRSVVDFIHILRLCLRRNCPLPDDESTLMQWAAAVDADVEDDQRMGIGALADFLPFLTEEEQEEYRDPKKTTADKAMMLLALGRMRDTPGVVFSSTKATNIPVRFHEHKPSIPHDVKLHFEHLKQTWETPRNDEIKDAMHMYRTVSQLSQGFFYRWVWPLVDGVEQPDLIWLEARKKWHRYVRGIVMEHNRYNLHSYKPVEDACARGEALREAVTFRDRLVIERLSQTVTLDSQAYRNWMLVKDRYTPVKEVVWIDKFLVNEVAEWLDKNVGIAWCGSIAFGDAIQKKGFRYYKGGQDEIRDEEYSCAASIAAHGRGKNLQQFAKGIVIDGPTRGRDWQQLIGRFDRKGQTADHVAFWLPLHAREVWQGFFQAGRDARYASAAGQQQKLVTAESFLTTDADVAHALTRSGDPLWRYPDPKKKNDT